jgi:hypothetical protein
MRLVILQSLFLLSLPIGAHADVGSSQVAQTAKLSAPRVAWDSASVVHGDFNGDGKQDAAILGIHQQRVFVAVVLASSAKAQKANVLSFGVGIHSTDSICELPAKLVVEPLECSPLDGPLPGCKVSLKAASLVLYGGECDPINFYWDHQNNKLAWWRV